MGLDFIVKTIPDMTTGDIRQTLRQKTPEFEREISTWVMRTREAGIREALIKLGWTPPGAVRAPDLQDQQPERTDTMEAWMLGGLWNGRKMNHGDHDEVLMPPPPDCRIETVYPNGNVPMIATAAPRERYVRFDLSTFGRDREHARLIPLFVIDTMPNDLALEYAKWFLKDKGIAS